MLFVYLSKCYFYECYISHFSQFANTKEKQKHISNEFELFTITLRVPLDASHFARTPFNLMFLYPPPPRVVNAGILSFTFRVQDHAICM